MRAARPRRARSDERALGRDRPFLSLLVLVLIAAGCELGLPGLPRGPAEAPSIAAPPGAVLETSAGGRMPGELGSYTYGGSGTGTPWLPADTLEPVAVTANEVVTVRLEGDVRIASASGAIAAAGDRQGARARVVRPDGPQADGAVEIVAPARGSWVLMVHLAFAESGEAAYYWRLESR